jgi:hypothetical protein
MVCIARQDRKLTGIVRFANHEIEFHDGLTAFLEERDGRLKISGENLRWMPIKGKPTD